MFRVAIPYVLVSFVALQTPAQNPPPRRPTPEQIQAMHDADVKERQEVTDVVWQKASAGFMKLERVAYKSRADGMSIPALVFTPLQPRGPKSHPALVWVHPDIHGHLYEYYYPYVREAVKRGYVVIAPEYRGSDAYGKEHFDAIDYGGAEVDDVVTAVDYLKTIPIVDSSRIGIIGWSHGGMITLLAATREPNLFKAAAALVPVTNLFQRLAWYGVPLYKSGIDPANRTGGLPNEKRDVYTNRSPVYQVDKLAIPLLVHVTRNDTDVSIEESMQLVDALRARKPFLSETKIYENPLGGHLFDRMCPERLPVDRSPGAPPRPQLDRLDLATYAPINTPEQRDSWNRVWTFLDWNLRPYQ